MRTSKNRKRTLSCALAAVMAAGLFTGCGTVTEDTSQPEATDETPATETVMPEYDFTVSYDGIATGNVSSGVSVHDPSIVKDNDTYYIFGSHMAAAKCDDLKSWKSMADGYTTSNPVYGQIYDVKEDAFAYAGDKISLIQTDDKKTHVWAPDVIYNKTTGLYYMYYCTTSTWNASNLCYGTSETIEGPYEWQGALIYSGFNKDTIQATDVLECQGQNPMEDPWIEKGKMTRADEDEFSFEAFSLDGTVFSVNGEWYYIWAEKVGVGKQISNLYIARMKNGYTLDTVQVLLTTPDYDWERHGFWVNEGPAVIQRDGKIFVTYSASDTGINYCMGMLTACAGDDLLDPRSWKKERYPVLASSAEAGVYGPGHNSFTTDEDGNDILVYHARTETEIVGDPLYNPNRHTMLMKFGWRDGKPVFDYT